MVIVAPGSRELLCSMLFVTSSLTSNAAIGAHR